MSEKSIDEQSGSWEHEISEINLKYFPAFVYASVIGIMAYAAFDYYSIPHLFKPFLAVRIFICISGFFLIYFLKKYPLKNQLILTTYLLFGYLFFGIGTAFMETKNQLITWNMSIVLGGLFWPHFMLVLKRELIVLVNLAFTFAYLVSFHLYSSFSITELAVQGGVFFVFGLIASYFIGLTRYRVHHSNYKLRDKLMNTNIELKNSHLVKDRFLAIVAHDLRGPMSGIISLSKLLKRAIDNGDTPSAKEFVDLIDSSSTKYFSFLNDLLDWSRAQAKRLEFKPEYVNPNDIFNDIVSLNEGTINEKSLKITVKIEPSQSLFADKQMLSSIFRNLLSNAIKFSNNHSEIQVKTALSENEFLFSIIDSGLGMDEETQQNLFKQDYIKSSYGTNNESGHGMGLFVCKEFIEKHGGKIWVNSKLGEGSTFCFTIPKST